MTRRAVLHGMGLALASAPLGALIGCGCSGATNGTGGAGVTSGTGGWATGGTASMSGNYPDPFAEGLGATCALTCSMTLGPCYAATLERKDISEGHDGLPMRLALLVVDESCKPIEGAEVDIWHTRPNGSYSGADALPFCTANDPDSVTHKYFRGVQTTDAKGRVDFDSCFPGWYPGRTIHIHLTVRVKGTEYLSSQLFFEDALSDEIINTQPLYADRGPRDTSNANDMVIAKSAVDQYICQTRQSPDGSLLAWKTLVIRSSTGTTLCTAPAGSGGRGMP